MTKIIEAVFENGALKPLDEVPLAEHQRVRLTIETDSSTSFISQHSEVRQGRPCVRGTGVEVMFIVWMHRAHGLTPEALADEFNLTAEQVQAALDYYAHHQQAAFGVHNGDVTSARCYEHLLTYDSPEKSARCLDYGHVTNTTEQSNSLPINYSRFLSSPAG
jgi:uncharacterized protein (DUF433 family)